MRYLILADIHGNLDAFRAVLTDAKGRGKIDGIWCLGDIVGYGPEPCQCLELLQGYSHSSVAGNHDWAAIGKIDTSNFNADAAAACLWTRKQLGPEDTEYLGQLPLTRQQGDFTLVHGSPREPIWEYLLSPASACANFALMETALCLVGHSHLPLLFEEVAPQRCVLKELPLNTPLELKDRRLIINPGAVGQPRDGNPLASYVLYDHDARALWHHRVSYDIAAVQRKMLDVALPPALAWRLSYGR